MPTNIIFHNNRTDNGKGRRATVSCSSSNKAWYITGNAGTWTDGQLNMNTSTWTASNITYYFYDYKNIFGSSVKCYAWQSNGSLYNAAYPGASLTAVQYGSGQLYSISLDCAFDEFKIGTGDSANTGDVWINQKTGQCFCWWDTGDSSWSNDLDWVKGHDWIYQTMHMRDISQETTTDTGACKGSSGYYNKAKTAYQSFSDGIKTKISQDDLWGATQTRFAAWARANGETASFSGTTLSVNSNIINLMNGITENFDSTIIIVVISSISAIAIGGFFFLRKKKTSK